MRRKFRIGSFLLLAVAFSLTAAPVFAARGGQDSGGGNLVDGKTLESYLVEPGTLPGYARLHVQLETLEKVRESKIHLRGALEKNWYLIPGPFSKLPPERIGAAVVGEQAALQDLSAVWIDKNLFEKMSEDEQASLLLHEIILGFRLLDLDSKYVQCRAIFAENASHFCEDEDRHPFGRPSDLTAGDYDSVRRIVRTLLKSPEQTPDAIERLFGDAGFGFPEVIFEVPKRAPRPEDLFQAFSTARLSESWPDHAYPGLTEFQLTRYDSRFPTGGASATGHCNVEVTMNPDGKGFVLTVSSETRAPMTVRVNKISEDDALPGYYMFYVDKNGDSLRDLPNDVSSIGHHADWLTIGLDPIGFERSTGYYTQASLTSISVGIDAVRVDRSGNDRIRTENQLACSVKSRIGKQP